mgnify:CR=1 FL=1
MFLKKTRLRGDYIMESENIIMRFEGENDIDLETLSNSLNSTVDTLKTLADQLVGENDFCKFKVLNIQKGSFVITINQIIEYAPLIFQYAPTVVQAFKEIVEIRSFLKGKPPASVVKTERGVEITNEKGIVYQANQMTFNIYDNSVEKGLANAAKSVLSDRDRTGLTYEFQNDKETKIINLNREELSYLSTPQDVEKFDKGIEENEIITWVKVRQPDLIGNSQWGLTLNGRNIRCPINDRMFLDKVHKNEVTFQSNTRLYVKMIIRYRINDFGSSEQSDIISRNIIEVLKIEND